LTPLWLKTSRLYRKTDVNVLLSNWMFLLLLLCKIKHFESHFFINSKHTLAKDFLSVTTTSQKLCFLFLWIILYLRVSFKSEHFNVFFLYFYVLRIGKYTELDFRLNQPANMSAWMLGTTLDHLRPYEQFQAYLCFDLGGKCGFKVFKVFLAGNNLI